MNVGVELEGRLRSGVAVLEVARIAFDDLAFLRDADFEERLAIIHRSAGIGDQPMRGAVAGMDVGVDEARRDELAGGVDGRVDAAVERLADMDDLVAFVDDNAVMDQPMTAGRRGRRSSRSDQGPHGRSISDSATNRMLRDRRRGPTSQVKRVSSTREDRVHADAHHADYNQARRTRAEH